MTSRHLSHATTEQALRQLDPSCRPSAMTPIEHRRADLTFERVVSSADATQAGLPDASTTYRGKGAQPGGRTRLRWVLPLGAATVAAVAAASALVPGGVAYASWSPEPVRLQPAQSAAAVSSCLELHRQTASPADRTLIAERRGSWAYVFIELPEVGQTSCIIPLEALGDDDTPADQSWAGPLTSEVSVDETVPEPGVGAGTTPGLGSRAVVQTVAAGGDTEEGALSLSEGSVGSDVVGVTVITTGGTRVIASVDTGRYAAWWPTSKDKQGPDDIGPAGFELTLRDGTTVHQALR